MHKNLLENHTFSLWIECGSVAINFKARVYKLFTKATLPTGAVLSQKIHPSKNPDMSTETHGAYQQPRQLLRTSYTHFPQGLLLKLLYIKQLRTKEQVA